ncbi:hypothetical protein U27_04949 [Candidatus Vecturithrix granuli]|uniref:DUF4384 domain-containing protein n=1 Tax=Vecturithrix granuli TaxID=1499967 RepID=A0A081C071_VECG1|nr:hypothetical protein U27_04949 [Candidatus Vecturithrix granuli]
MTFLNRHTIIVLLLLSSSMSWFSAQAQETSFSPEYEKLINTLEELKPAESIVVRMGTEKEEYNLGEPFELRFQVSQESYITLMDISPEGDITFIVPSIKVPENKVEADKVYSTLHHFELPIKIAPPTGYETINLFCTTEPFTFFDTTFEQEPFYTIKKDDKERLSALIARLEQLKEIVWAGTSVQFFIRSATRGAGPSPARKFGAIPPVESTGTSGVFFPPLDPTGTTGKTENPVTP